MSVSILAPVCPEDLPCAYRPIVHRLESLVGIPHWVVARNKAPYCARDSWRASVNDPETWSTFKWAAWAASGGSGCQVGFVLTEDDPFTFIDLDHCRDPETGFVQPWAREIIDRFESYAEVSCSGTGVHILIEGRPPEAGRRCAMPNGGALEVYFSSRYMIVTGDHLPGTPERIEDRQQVLTEFWADHFEPTSYNLHPPPKSSHSATDEEVLAKARSAANREKFIRLFDLGDFSDYPSQSEADLALCSLLAYWTARDLEQMDRLFRQSRLMREKWERPDYRESTLRKALECGTWKSW